ncbi:NADH-ubiquinone oxidoreductase chain N [Pseudonocardia sp. Ae168_Ps1]|uniref:NADH-quinone oxidoreductase subunit NuoN n=1 Tax=unclassified Pseudonocardia TaxID=2619320 RepID=UPI00094B1EA4|nr:NADH-ubiquinone oxidoreductase chain N [Pseudonocardia sp. Ae150A_Ps1]OLL80215.1 NADH-ubiquinone oxidoreductase chain N [Pseudonocardia sp. Ae168_Ps1]OLL85658.1 NADH-ubiquinone oxidoreductase chain N [Pseudonocardia sp. Ae263_Ps1]OLL94312.1 NADH-ubiquinone oxidoreductase chain N [Pseudonocardia sp. Ae356_Ps1]
MTVLLPTALPAQVTQIEMPPIDWAASSPLWIVFAGACVSVLPEAFLPRHQRWPVQVLWTGITLVAALVALAGYALSSPGPVLTFGAALAVDSPALFLWGTLIVLAIPSLLLLADRSVEPGGVFVASAAERAAARAGVPATGGGAPPEHVDRSYGAPDEQPTMQTEPFPFVLFALGGMMAFVAANDLLTMFIALEVLSLPLYLMCGLARRRRLLSQEAAVKYFLLGAFGSAFFLYGIALLYGYAGSVRLSAISQATAGTLASDTLLFAGLALLLVGLLFKGSVAPFHTWTPDVYQGAPTPVTAFMAACTKVAAFGAIARVLYVGFGSTVWEWRGVLWAVAIVSMVVGAVLGLTQSDVKRMIAYSSIAHAGFILLGAMALTPQGTAGLLFYLLAYGFTTVAVFGVVSLVRGPDGEASHLSAWAGLAKRSPLAAGIMTFLLLALAGIPLTSGFTAKFAVFSAASADGMVPLVVIALVASAVAAFFYLRIVVLMYFSEPAEDGPTVVVPGAFTTVAITLGTLATLVLGILPTPVLEWAASGAFAG